jgi:hypothetical protein
MAQNRTFRYFSKVAGSMFHFPDGFSIQFAHGFFDLKEEDYEGKIFQVNTINNNPPHHNNGKPAFVAYKEELDAIIKAGNPLFYIQGTQPEPLPKVRDSRGREGADANAKSEAELAASEAIARGLPGKETGDVNAGATRTGVNESTVDVGLQAALLAEKAPANAGAARLAAIRAAAATASGSASNSNNKAE